MFLHIDTRLIGLLDLWICLGLLAEDRYGHLTIGPLFTLMASDLSKGFPQACEEVCVRDL